MITAACWHGATSFHIKTFVNDYLLMNLSIAFLWKLQEQIVQVSLLMWFPESDTEIQLDEEDCFLDKLNVLVNAIAITMTP